MNTILNALDRNRLLHPKRRAIHGSSCSLSWKDLHFETSMLSESLAGHLVVGIFMENSPAWAVADLAAMHAGLSNVPLPLFFSNEQLRHAITDACVDIIITDNVQRIESLVKIRRADAITICGRQYAQVIVDGNTQKHSGNACAKVTYTSGSTGTPRGVRLSMKAIERVSASLTQAVAGSNDDRGLAVMPLSILLENIGSIYLPILAGAESIILNGSDLGISGSSQVDPERFARALQHYRPTSMIVPPQVLKLLVALGQRDQLPNSFRFIAVGGAPTAKALLESSMALGLPVYQGYGLSETCSVVSVNTPTNNRVGSVGKPLPHTTVRIDTEGQIHVSGAASDGYLDGPDFAANTEIATGDTGYFDDDGYLYVTGRRANTIITGYGRNISPEWIEAELLAHPLIAQVAVFESEAGELIAVIVPLPIASQLQIRAAVEDVNRSLPDYAQIHRHVIKSQPFSRESGELTITGKPVRDAIRQQYTNDESIYGTERKRHVF